MDVRSLGGTKVAWDFVELPSQIMENWCWEREALDMFATALRNGRTNTRRTFPENGSGTNIPRSKCTNATTRLRQRSISICIANTIPNGDDDVLDFSRTILEAHSPTKLPDDYAFVTSFSHLFSSPVGYAAGYYSYKWSEVLDADAFTRFRNEGVFARNVGESFRRSILARGDSRDPMESYREFMGRDPKLEPLLERQGLT